MAYEEGFALPPSVHQGCVLIQVRGCGDSFSGASSSAINNRSIRV